MVKFVTLDGNIYKAWIMSIDLANFIFAIVVVAIFH